MNARSDDVRREGYSTLERVWAAHGRGERRLGRLHRRGHKTIVASEGREGVVPAGPRAGAGDIQRSSRPGWAVVPPGIEWSMTWYGPGPAVRHAAGPPGAAGRHPVDGGAFGTEVLYTREGGSGPEADLQDVTGAPVVFLGISLPEDGGTRPTRRSTCRCCSRAPRPRPTSGPTWPGRCRGDRALPDLALARAVVDRDAGRRTDPAWLAAAWADGRPVLGCGRPRPRSWASRPGWTWPAGRTCRRTTGSSWAPSGVAYFAALERGRHRRRARAAARAARGRCRLPPSRPASSCTPCRWPTDATHACPRCGATGRRTPVTPLRGRRQRALPAHRRGGHHAGPRRGRPAAAGPADHLAGGPVLDPGRLRRAGSRSRPRSAVRCTRSAASTSGR